MTNTTQINITGGSEKQNAWATEIVSKWIATLDAEIDNATARPESDGVGWYVEALKAGRDRMIAGLPKMTARQVIDFQNSPHHGPVTHIIDKARKR